MNDKDLELKFQEILARYGRENPKVLAEELSRAYGLKDSQYFSDQLEEELGHKLDASDQEKVNHLFRHLYHRRCS